MPEIVDETEDIARAICSNHWDRDAEMASPSLFKGLNTSVSRLDITPLVDTWDLFRTQVEKPPERKLERIGTINVGVLAETGRDHSSNTTALSVIEDPLPGFGAHAIIPQKISRGLANQILKRLELHERAN